MYLQKGGEQHQWDSHYQSPLVDSLSQEKCFAKRAAQTG